ncbi:MAG: hypothetical protein ACKO42_03375 [Gammaproteobacteria bacterium]
MLFGEEARLATVLAIDDEIDAALAVERDVQGAGAVKWPVIATILRFVIAVGAAWLGVTVWQASLEYVFVCIAAGMVVYGVVTAASIRLGAWRQSSSQ